MKINTLIKNGMMVLCAATAVTTVSCVNELTEDVPTTRAEIIADINKRFDYNCWTPVKLKVNAGAKTYVTIYDGDPATGKVNEVRAFPTDNRGYFECDIELNSAFMGKSFFAVTDEGEKMEATLTENGLDFKARAASRDGGSYAYGPDHDVKDLCRHMREFYHTLFPEYGNQYSLISNYLGLQYHSGNGEPWWWADKDLNIKTTCDTEIWINMVDFGEKWRKSSEGAFDGLGEYQAQLYYYYWKDENVQLHHEYGEPVYFSHTFCSDKFRLIPDPADYPNGSRFIYSSDDWNTDANLGKKVRLKFYGDRDPNNHENPAWDIWEGTSDGTDGYMSNFTQQDDPSYVFPAGYNIGFVLLMGKFNHLNQGKNVMILSDPIRGSRSTTATTWYDQYTRENDKAALCVAFSGDDMAAGLWPDDVDPLATGDVRRLFYTYEDNPDAVYDQRWWEDDTDLWDYNDFMFMVSVDEQNPEQLQRATRYGTYIFEDMYPDKGDYDMNDVMVEYFYKVEFNADNTIKKFSYTITPKHNGADYVNDFWLAHTRPGKDPVAQCIFENNITVQKNRDFFGSAYVDSEGHIHSTNSKGGRDLFAESFIGMTYSDVNFWCQKERVDEANTYFGIDPFIYVNHGDNNQVHLANFQWLNIGKGAAASDNLYLQHYLLDSRNTPDAGKEMPFAIDLGLLRDLTPPKEFIPMTEQYSKFELWIVSHGTQYEDWIFQP